METQSITPLLEDKAIKALLLVVLVPLADLVTKKLGTPVDANLLYGVIAACVTYVVMHKWKSGTVLAAEVTQRTAADYAAIRAKLGADPDLLAQVLAGLAKPVELPKPTELKPEVKP